jgi:acyl-CoA synthetase (AMP-forming)/AMP-acid ligase II
MSFTEILRSRARESPDDLAFAFLEDGVHETARLTYAQLHARAEEIGAVLEPGSRVLLLLPPGLDYIAAIFACFAADAIAVSAAPPTATQLDRALPRLEAIVADADATAILTDTLVRSVAEPLFRREVTWLAVDALPEPRDRQPYEPGELAFLQYTSGSTGQPKGVLLSHANLLANCRSIVTAFGTTRESVVYSWLPPYHDMGLIGGILHPVLVGAPCHVTSPITIIRRPLRWLEAVSELKVTVSGGPNFMYDLCVKRARNLDGLDLSSWRVAVNGAEPVRAATMAAFQATFGPYGFRKDALTAAYGLAESTLLLAAAPEPTVTSFDREGLLEGKAILGEGAELVGCGWTDEAHQIRIVDPETGETCDDGIVGEIWAAGPSIAAGYWRNPEATAEVFGGGWMRTGDLGFVHAAQLYIAGRRKEVLIVHGVNHHPHDLEVLAEDGEPLLRPHCSAAFEVDSEVVLVAELARDHAGADLAQVIAGVIAGVRARVSAGTGVRVRVVLVEARTVPKTTSGKIQRLLLRQRLLAGELEIIAQEAT